MAGSDILLGQVLVVLNAIEGLESLASICSISSLENMIIHNHLVCDINFYLIALAITFLKEAIVKYI
jgi:hypothetical protein